MTAKTAVVPSTMRKAQAQYRFSPGVVAGGLLFVSGQVGWDEDGNVVAEPEAQYVAAFENLGEVLAAAGASFGDVVELDSFHTSFDDLDSFMSVKRRYFDTEPYPTWTAIGVTALPPPGVLVEVKCTAVVPQP